MNKDHILLKLKNIVTGSFFLSAIVLILQILFWFLFYYLITGKLNGHYVSVIRGFFAIFVVIFITYVVMRCSHPSYQITWLIFLAIAPAAAFILYLIMRIFPGTVQLANMVQDNINKTSIYLKNEHIEQHDENINTTKYKGLFQYLSDSCGYPSYYSDSATYYHEGDLIFSDMMKDIRNAERFIFLEYFIIDKGSLWDELFSLLQEKVKQGVEVRLLYDGLCSLKLPRGFAKQIAQTGIKCRVFSPLRPVISSYQNNRDHRKITVIDGKISYTGGVNIADEYVNRKERFGHWKDCGIRFTGNAAQSMTAMFLQLWSISGGKNDLCGEYMATNPNLYRTETILAPYGDSPENNRDTAEDVYCQILDLAENYVYIMTPYLILDHRIQCALCFAAERGVEVKLLLPHIPDKKIAFLAARSHYLPLMSSGVKIYEYTPGFVHSKVFVSDDCIATVGTVNLDFRSLFLHFENGTLIYDKEVAEDIAQDFQTTLELCEQITPAIYYQLPVYQRALGHVARVLGPLM